MNVPISNSAHSKTISKIFKLKKKIVFCLFQRKDSMEFLHDIVPKKVKFGDFLKMMEEEKSSDDEDLL